MKRFSNIKEIDRSKITLDPKLFQGRQTKFSEDTVNSIVSKGSYDKSAEPIVVWKDDSRGKFIVISGHSRWEAAKRLFESGKQQDLKTIPVKEFLGDLESAIDYATLESNRGSTEEGLISDLEAYRRAVAKGYNREKLLSIFKPESKLQKLKELSYLNPKGKFVEELSKASSRSFPYLERNARWVGQLRKMLPQLTDAHETELFNYFYKGKQANLKLTKDKFLDLVDKRVNRIDFDAESALNIENRVSSNALTDPITDQIKEIEQDINRFQARIQKKRESIVKAKGTNLPDKDGIIETLELEIANYEKAILRKMEEQNKLRQQKGKLERETIVDLFSAPEEKSEPKKKVLRRPDRIKTDEEILESTRPKVVKAGELANIILSNKTYFGVKTLEVKFVKGSFFGSNHWRYWFELPNGEKVWLDNSSTIEPFDPSTQKKGDIENAFPLLDPTGDIYKLALSAWNWTSHRPEKRGQNFMEGHEASLKSTLKDFKKVAKANDTESAVNGHWERYISKYRDFVRDYLYRQSNIASSMIAGPANFPVARNQKKMDAQDKTQKKWDAWEKKAQKAIFKDLKNEPIATGNPTDELKVQQAKLKDLQYNQEIFKKVNAAYRAFKKNPSSLDKSDLPDKFKKLVREWEPQYSYEKAPFPTWQLQNNNANLKRVQARVSELESKSAIAESGQVPSHEFEGGRVDLNAVENRIQIFFDDKPDFETRSELKKNGFKWAPSKKAWQRMITDNAIMKTAWLSFIKYEGKAIDLFKQKVKTVEPVIAEKKAESIKPAEVDENHLWAKILLVDRKKALTYFEYKPGYRAKINKHGVFLPYDEKTKRYEITIKPKEDNELARLTANVIKHFPPKNEGVRLRAFSEDGGSRTYYDYSNLVGREITWNRDNKNQDYTIHVSSKSDAKEKVGFDLKGLSASIRGLLNNAGGDKVKVITKTTDKVKSNHHILIEMRDGSPLNKRTINILKSWPIDQNLIKGYGAIIYIGYAEKVQQAIRDLYKEGGKTTMGCPPMKDGKRLIDDASIKHLEKCINDAPQTKDLHIDKDGVYSPERLKLHAKLIGEFKKKVKCTGGKQPIAILTGGAPGSGKSTFLKEFAPWLLSDNVYHIDADEIRAKLPEYKGWNASNTHEETSDLTKALIEDIGKPCEYDLIYDGTMNKAKKYKPLVEQLKQLGYKVFVIYLEVPKKVSVERVLGRYQRSGRYVPMSVIDEIYDNGLEAYEEVIKMADGYIKVNGVTQKIIDQGGMAIPKRRKLSSSPIKKDPTNKDLREIEGIRKSIKNQLVLNEDQVLAFGQKINSLRKVSSQKIDSSQINKKVLPLTAEGLFRWASNPGAYDLKGVDAPKDARVTVKPRKVKELKTASKSAGGFWQKLWSTT